MIVSDGGWNPPIILFKDSGKALLLNKYPFTYTSNTLEPTKTPKRNAFPTGTLGTLIICRTGCGS